MSLNLTKDMEACGLTQADVENWNAWKRAIKKMERSSIPQHDDYDVTDFITVFSVPDDCVKSTDPLWLG